MIPRLAASIALLAACDAVGAVLAVAAAGHHLAAVVALRGLVGLRAWRERVDAWGGLTVEVPAPAEGDA